MLCSEELIEAVLGKGHRRFEQGHIQIKPAQPRPTAEHEHGRHRFHTATQILEALENQLTPRKGFEGKGSGPCGVAKLPPSHADMVAPCAVMA